LNFPLHPWVYTIRPEKPPENWKERLLKALREIL